MEHSSYKHICNTSVGGNYVWESWGMKKLDGDTLEVAVEVSLIFFKAKPCLLTKCSYPYSLAEGWSYAVQLLTFSSSLAFTSRIAISIFFNSKISVEWQPQRLWNTLEGGRSPSEGWNRGKCPKGATWAQTAGLPLGPASQWSGLILV